MLEEIVKRTELDMDKDSLGTAFLKGMVVGAVEGLIVLGALHTIDNVITIFKKD